MRVPADHTMRDGAWVWLANLDPAAFYWGPDCKVNLNAIARRAGVAGTCLTKLHNGQRPLTDFISDRLLALAMELGPGEEEARKALYVPARPRTSRREKALAA